jgi:hypothetical protein
MRAQIVFVHWKYANLFFSGQTTRIQFANRLRSVRLHSDEHYLLLYSVYIFMGLFVY